MRLGDIIFYGFLIAIFGGGGGGLVLGGTMVAVGLSVTVILGLCVILWRLLADWWAWRRAGSAWSRHHDPYGAAPADPTRDPRW